jgi:hypothetical protein
MVYICDTFEGCEQLQDHQVCSRLVIVMINSLISLTVLYNIESNSTLLCPVSTLGHGEIGMAYSKKY